MRYLLVAVSSSSSLSKSLVLGWFVRSASQVVDVNYPKITIIMSLFPTFISLTVFLLPRNIMWTVQIKTLWKCKIRPLCTWVTYRCKALCDHVYLNWQEGSSYVAVLLWKYALVSFCETSQLDSPASLQVFHTKY